MSVSLQNPWFRCTLRTLVGQEFELQAKWWPIRAPRTPAESLIGHAADELEALWPASCEILEAGEVGTSWFNCTWFAFCADKNGERVGWNEIGVGP